MREIRWWGAARPAALLAVVPLLAGCVGEEQAVGGGPNLLIVSIDSLRADHVSASGYRRDVTPRLDAFLEEATWFTDAVSAAPWTTPSMMSMITGLEAEAHQVQAPDFALAPEALTLAERLQEAGYRTGAVVPAVTLGPHFGFAQGFDRYESFNYGHNKLTSRRLNATARRLIEIEDPRPWFVWVHYWDPHYNYNPPEPEASRYPTDFTPEPGTRYNVADLKRLPSPLRDEEIDYLRAQYDAEIRYNDRFLGELLDLLEARGETGETLVVVLADHGEAFQEHGWLGHTNRVDETLIHVPLAFRWPGVIRAGERIDGQVGVVDLLPTVLELLGLDPGEGGLMGRSLAATLREGAPVGESALGSMTVRRGAWYSLRIPPLKYVLDFESCEARLYDLEADPGEMRDLSGERPEDLERLAAAAAERLALSRSLGLPALRPGQEDEQTVEMLVALGYMTAPGDTLGDPDAETSELRPARCFEEGEP
jgi:arylsulfatase A-like enzyme